MLLDKLELLKIRRHFPRRGLPDLRRAVRDEVAAAWTKTAIRPGETVALTVGSRGVANLSLMVRAICDAVKDHGAKPIIIPAMGSHGGATPEGQTEVLAGYGVTRESSGAEIDARMEVKHLGASPEGLKVFVAKSALEADHIVVFNRIKPHTDFRGEVESGLCKIMAIGLGKRAGASYYHRAILDFGFALALESAGRHVLKNCRVAFGLGVVEDAHEDTALVRHLMPEEMVDQEKEMLKSARDWMPSLPFMKADILMIDRIGKNISGTVMDTNITGRFQNVYTPGDLPEPKIRRIYARDITEESHGNFCGLGRADFISRRLYDKLDFEATYINCITGLGMENGRLPIVRRDDRQALEALNITIGHVPPPRVKLIWIRDTLSLAETIVSGAYRAEIERRDDLEIVEVHTPRWDEEGYLLSPWAENRP